MAGSKKSFFPAPPAAKSSIAQKSRSTTTEKRQIPDQPETSAKTGQREGDSVENVALRLSQSILEPRSVSSQDIPTDRLRPNPFQARQEFTQADIDELAASIEKRGFISVLFVRPDPSEDGYFQIAFGERRLRAAKQAGVLALPCRIEPYTDEQMDDMGLAENLQRKDLNPLEEAFAYQRKMQQIDPTTGKTFSIRGLADHLGVKKSRVEERLRLCSIPSDVEIMVRQRADTIRVAFEIAKIPVGELRSPLIESVLQGEVSTKDIIFLVEQTLTSLASLPSDVEQMMVKKPETAIIAFEVAMVSNTDLRKGLIQQILSGTINNEDIVAKISLLIKNESEPQFEDESDQIGTQATQDFPAQQEVLSSESDGQSDSASSQYRVDETVAFVSSSTSSAIMDLSVQERLRGKQIETDSKTVLKIVRRWLKLSDDETYNKADLHAHVLSWLTEIEQLEQTIRSEKD
jgi:ParB/RepB/Spo0J family partition protein